MSMRKQEFLDALRERLSGFPQNDLDERLGFYAEMIDDRMEDGLTEEEAVSAIGSVDDVVAQILRETPMTKLVKEKIKPQRRLKAWEIVLLAVGSPVWLPLLIAAFVVLLAVYVVIWSVVVSLWAVFTALAAYGVGGLAAGIIFLVTGNGLSGAFMLAAAPVCAGLAIFAFFGCKEATRGMAKLTKAIVLSTKKLLIRKEGA